MGIFDDVLGNDKQQEQKKDNSLIFSLFTDVSSNPIKPKNHKPSYKNLEAYSSDEEADEDGFFDENPL